jgi:hypothetical protein
MRAREEIMLVQQQEPHAVPLAQAEPSTGSVSLPASIRLHPAAQEPIVLGWDQHRALMDLKWQIEQRMLGRPPCFSR